MAQARLNRRRYREIVATLKEVIADRKAPQQRRLRAIEMLLAVYGKHDKQEERRLSRKQPTEPETQEPSAEITETAEEAADRLIASVGQSDKDRDDTED